MTQTAPAQKNCKLPSLHTTHITHVWKSHEQRIGCHPQHPLPFFRMCIETLIDRCGERPPEAISNAKLFAVELLTLWRVFRFTSHINPHKLMQPAGRELMANSNATWLGITRIAQVKRWVVSCTSGEIGWISKNAVSPMWKKHQNLCNRVPMMPL